MASVKERVLNAVNRLPADANFCDINEEIALLEAISEAETDIKEGRLISNDVMKA